jgi:glycosyltransferase involved in cell wall biosynthesis
LQAYRICKANGRKMAVVIIGDGPERKVLQAEAERLGLDDVLFTGNVPHADVASWYSIMDVLVYPRIRAVINERVTPLKPLEAMALGKVCVSSDVGGLTELIHDGETGVVFRADDEKQLADVLTGLMNDPDRMARLRTSALSYVRTVRDWGRIVPKYADLYDRVVRAKRGVVLAPAPVADGRY